MKSTALEDLYLWSAYQPDRRIDFSGFFWARPGGGVVIDPLPLSTAQHAFIVEHGGVADVVVTNADHMRASADVQAAYGAKVYAPACDEAAIGSAADAWFDDASDLPESLQGEVGVHWLRGGKTAREAVLYLEPLRAIVFGDAVRSHASGVLRLLPEPKVRDHDALVADVRALRDLAIDAVLLGDGDSLFTGAGDAFRDFVDGL